MSHVGFYSSEVCKPNETRPNLVYIFMTTDVSPTWKYTTVTIKGPKPTRGKP